MQQIKTRKNIWIYVLFLLLQLLAILYIKYLNQDLPLSEFNLGLIGNLFLLVVYSCLIITLIINSIKEKKIISNKTIIIFLFLSSLLLFISFISTKLDIGLNTIYFFGQPGNKLFTGLLFTSFLILLFSFLLHSFSFQYGPGKPSFIKNVYGSVLMLFILILMTFIYINTLGYTSEKWQLNRSNRNVTVVLGAAVWSGNLPSPTLAGRVDKALELLNSGYTGKILVTGSSAPGEMTEAEVAYNYLVTKGVDTTLISIETTTRSTAEQIQFIRNKLVGLKSVQDIIVISDSYHLPRVIEISKFFNLDIKVAESRHITDYKDRLYNKIRESIALFIFWCLAL